MENQKEHPWASVIAMCILVIGGFYTIIGGIDTYTGQQMTFTYNYWTGEDLTVDSEKLTINYGSGCSLSINDFMDGNGTQEYNETLLKFSLPAINSGWANITLQFTLESNNFSIDNTSLFIGLVSGSWNENITTWNSRPTMGRYVQCQPNQLVNSTLSFDISNLLRSVDLDHHPGNLSFFVKLPSPSDRGIITYSHRSNNSNPTLSVVFVTTPPVIHDLLAIGIVVDLIAVLIYIFNYIHRKKYQASKYQDLSLSKQLRDFYNYTPLYPWSTINLLHELRSKRPETRYCPYCGLVLDIKPMILLNKKGFVFCDRCGSEILF